MAFWEYKTLTIKAEGWFVGGRVDTNKLNQEINELGSLGWELVSGFDINQAGGASREIVIIFKRSKG